MKIRKMLVAVLLSAGSLCMQAYAHSHGNYVHSDLMENLKAGDKAALLLVHFGTTHDDTRALTIDAINAKAKQAFPDMEIREAYTSRIIKYRLAQRGIEKKNPVEALAQLKADGYTHIIVQSTNIIDGVEMESLRKDVSSMSFLFKEIRVGTPLLYQEDDYRRVVDILSEKGKENRVTMLVGHGTYTPATAQYAMLDYMMQAEGHEDFVVGTVEGYPSFNDAVARIQGKKKVKQIQLLPFMFVAGDHAKNDIAGDMKQSLEEKGYQVTVLMEGLGQNPEIQDLFIEHALFMMHHRLLDINEKKKEYAKGRDVF